MGKQFNGIIFDGRIDEDYREKAINYFLGLPPTNSPFDCKNLRVLPQAVKLIHTYKPPTNYEKNTLICCSNVKNKGLDRKCNIHSVLKLNEEGDLVFECSKDGETQTINLRLVNFQEFKK